MKFKLLINMLLIIILLFSKTSVFAYSYYNDPNFIEIDPFAVLPSGQIALDADVLFAWDEVYVTLTYMATTATPRIFTVTLTDGAEFLVNSVEDIFFTAGTDGVEQPVIAVTIDENIMTVTTPNNAFFQENTIRFGVLVPWMATSFSIDVGVDVGFFQPMNTPTIFDIRSYFTIEAPYEADDVDPFVVSGNALLRGEYPPPGSFVLLEIVRLRPDGTAYEFPESVHMAPIVNGRYYQDILLQTEHESGEFLIRAYLMPPDGSRSLSFAQRPIQFTSRPNELTIEAPDVVIYGEPFIISGSTLSMGEAVPSGSFVFLEIVRLRDDGTAYAFPCAVHMIPVVDGIYSQEILLQTQLDSGEFLIRVFLLLPDGSQILAMAQRPIQFIRP
ncbi:MAG: hypothetical protein FWC91_11685 [Defluviitaleaceae bacterium]|nr:hypothetical protein [Defluviitaleaceae bacterium]